MAKLKIIPGVLDIEIVRGSTLDFTATLRDQIEEGQDKNTLAAAVADGATTFTLRSSYVPPVGGLVVFGDGSGEEVVVQSVNGLVVTVTAALTFDHAAATQVKFKGALLDLTQYTSAKAQWRASSDAAAVLDELTTTVLPPTPPAADASRRVGAIVLGGAAGTVRFVTPRAVLSEYPDESVWDVAFYTAGGAAWYPLGGSTTIVDGATE